MSAPDKPENAQGGDFLSRWSRRKVEAKEQADIDRDQATDIDPALKHTDEADEKQFTEEQLAELSDEEILEELGLPDPDTMKAGDDFKGFMKSAVPTRLRNRALRKLWLSDPTLANVDMLVDYGGDFTDAATVIPNMKTAYEVGRGIAKQYEELMEKLKQEEAATQPEVAEPEAEAAEDVVSSSETMVEESVDMVELVPDVEVVSKPPFEGDSSESENAEPEPVYMPRRMKFTV